MFFLNPRCLQLPDFTLPLHQLILAFLLCHRFLLASAKAGNNLVSAPELYPALHRRVAAPTIQQTIFALVFLLSGFFRRKERIQRRIQNFRHHVAHRLSPSSNV